MDSPCPRCGTFKTESVHHGFVYAALWKMGYHLRRCSFCNRKRMFERPDPTRPHPDNLTMEDLQRSFDRKIAQSLGKPVGVSTVHRASVSSDFTEDGDRHSGHTGTSSNSVAVATNDVVENRVCPNCGSSRYRRSRRRWYEKVLKRPRMARCKKCDHRFPYPHEG